MHRRKLFLILPGSAAAFFAREALGPDVRITVFEKYVLSPSTELCLVMKLNFSSRQARVGGRVHDLTIGGVNVEAGASIYHKVRIMDVRTSADVIQLNQYVSNFTSLFNLKSGVAGGGRMGIWNGHSFVFEESDYKLINIAKVLLCVALLLCACMASTCSNMQT